MTLPALPDPDTDTDPDRESSGPARTLPAFTPVPRKKAQGRGFTPARQRRFIEALADSGSVKSAARAVGLTTRAAYALRRAEGAEEFRKAWEAALDLGVGIIEDVAMDRALNGVEQPVFNHEGQIGTRTAYNDQLLMFMLRNRAPGRFTDGRARALNGADKFMLARLKKEWRAEWEREKLLERKRGKAEVLASLNAKLDAMRDRRAAAMSPETLRLRDAFEESLRRDRESGYSWLDAVSGAGAGEEAEEAPATPSPEMQKLLPGARVREEPDDGWEIVDYDEEYGRGAAEALRAVGKAVPE